MRTVSMVLTICALASASAFCAAETPASGDGPRKPDAEIAPAEIASAIQRGIQILLEKQESLENKDVKGEWPYEGVYRVDGKSGREIPLGYRVGGTAICAQALVEATQNARSAEVDEAVKRALEFVLDAITFPQMKAGFDGTYDVRGWGHTYALEFLLCLRRNERIPEGHRKAVNAAARALIAALEKTAIEKNGGWNYARGASPSDAAASTFMTAPTLQVLFEAKRQSFDVDARVVKGALDTLEAARLPSGAFQYKSNPEHQTGEGFEDVRGSTGRSPVSEATLYLAGRGSQERVQGALDLFFEHWEWLEKRRRQSGTHAKPYMIAPYYFFYAHRYAAQAIECLPEESRAGYRQKLYRLLWQVREASGGWNDREFPRSENFGTAMTISALCEPTHERPAGWTGK